MKTKKKSLKSLFSKEKLPIMISVTISLVCIVALVATSYANNKRVKELEDKLDSILNTSAGSTEISDEQYNEWMKESKGIDTGEDGTLVEDMNVKKEYANQLFEIATFLRDNNAYLGVQVSDVDYDTYVYSKNGEFFMESGLYGTRTIGLKDGKQFIIQNNVVTGTGDMDILTLVERVATVVQTKDSKFYIFEPEADALEEGVEYYSGTLVLDGWKSIYDFYSSVDAVYAEKLVKQLMSGNSKDITVKFTFGVDSEKGFAINNTVVVDRASENEDYTIFTNWNLNGYELLDNWSLDEAWYSVLDSENMDCSDLLNSTYEQLAELIGIDLEVNEEQNEENTDFVGSVDASDARKTLEELGELPVSEDGGAD